MIAAVDRITQTARVLRGGRNANGICAVYRVKNDETLKRLKRVPSGLDWTAKH